MNANELNKWIENSPYTEQEEVVILLRQLQAEIESLKAEIKSIEKNTDYWADKSAKTLTDEEIDELVYEYNCIDDYPHEFVRACIRKAQENG